MTVTIFKSLNEINSPHQTNIEQVFERIQRGASKNKVESIRAKLLAGEEYDEEKLTLPFVVFSAAETQAVPVKDKMSHRADASVTKHSGLFVLDFDKCNVEQKLEQLRSDPYIFATWIAPSGTGVKGLVKCPQSIQNHNLYYTAFLERYPELDPTSRNISRGTFESYDPNIWVNSGSLVWDKKLSEEDRKKNKEKSVNRRGNQVISTAVAMVRSSYDGTKHETLLKAANLLGGYIASGRVNEEEAVRVLLEEIKQKGPKDLDGAKRTIEEGIAYGKARPLAESKKIEKQQSYLRREDGSYDFLADEEEMDEYLRALIGGYLEMGLPLVNGLNQNWVLKKNTLVWWGALDNVGKSFLVWYLAVLAALFHGWKIMINSGENSDGEVRKKLMEYLLGKSVKLMDDEEIGFAHQFIKKHFKIMSSKNLHTMEEFLLKAELVYDEGWEFDLLIGEPYNSFDMDVNVHMHQTNMKNLNMLRVFKENYSAVWITDHIGTLAARKKDKEGFIETPWKSDIDSGQLKASKTDDFIILHRLVNHPISANNLQIHINKVKSVETGGYPTQKDEPVIFEMNSNYCGYRCGHLDMIEEFWKKHKIQEFI